MNSLQELIQQRNSLFIQIRAFFSERQVLEVDTPLLGRFTVTDPYMSAFSVISSNGQHDGYLQTSPEYAMKKLLCAGSGDIYQLSKMFRANEKGDIHAGEFSMLEWYRIGFDHFQLIEEVCQLLQQVVGKRPINRLTYQKAFISHLGIDPFCISLQALAKKSIELLGDIPQELLFDNYLSLLFSAKVEASFDPESITVVYEFPESQASLAKIRTENGQTSADRFEVYLGGMELANGFNELTDYKQQHQRFEEDNHIRRKLGSSVIDIDMDLIDSLEKGLPDCAGVALGVDRLLMIKLGAEKIGDVLLSP